MIIANKPVLGGFRQDLTHIRKLDSKFSHEAAHLFVKISYIHVAKLIYRQKTKSTDNRPRFQCFPRNLAYIMLSHSRRVEN